MTVSIFRNRLGGSILVVAVAAAVFGLDLALPHGRAVPMLYVLPILLTWLVPGNTYTVLVAGMTLIMTWATLLFSHEGFSDQTLERRALVSIVFVLVAAFLVKQKQMARQVAQTQEMLLQLNATLEQRVTERAADLVQANERWDWVTRATHDGIWDWNLLNDSVYYSPRWKEMHGLPEAEVLESVNAWSARIHPEDRDQVLGRLQGYLERTRPEYWEEYRIQRKDGGYFWVLDRGIAMWDEQGRAVRMVGAETDITWRKEAEEGLRLAEARQRVLLTATPAVIYSCKASGDYGATFVSENVLNQLGYPARNFTEQSDFWLTHVHPDDRPRVLAELTTILEKEQHEHEYRFRRKDGTYGWLHDELQVKRNEAGVPEELIGFMIDITRRKQAEILLRAREEELRALNTKLLQVQEDERRRIARDLHDDFMQRLAAFTIELRSLYHDAPDADSALSSRLYQLGTALEQLTMDLQGMAHQLHPSTLEHLGLEAAVREHVDEFAARTGLTTDILVQNVPTHVPLILATCLYRVLQESLHNVQKHAQATNVLVRLLRTIGGLGLCVHDDGRGFENAQDASGRKGLGLTSMAERVEAVKGRFRIKTKPGDGTEIHAWVPLHDVARHAAPSAERG